MKTPARTNTALTNTKMRKPTSTNPKRTRKNGQTEGSFSRTKVGAATAIMLGAEDVTDAAEVPHDSDTNKKLDG